VTDIDIWREAAQASWTQTQLDMFPPQAILDVVVVPEPENATITFTTTQACYATIELYTVRTGSIDLDMEKVNRERIEVEVFGAARTSHRIKFFDLPQERRFWFRISVPGSKTPTGLGQTRVRYRSWFSTFRRTASLSVNTILVINDSDTSSAGDLQFWLAVYNAWTGVSQLVPSRRHPDGSEMSVDSGVRLHGPFGGAIDLGRVPDRIAVYLHGFDDDENGFVSFTVAPWEGLSLTGKGVPFELPPAPVAYSDRLVDFNGLLAFATMPVTVGRSDVRLEVPTPPGALTFQMSATISCNVEDLLGQPTTFKLPFWKGIKAFAPMGGVGGQRTKSGLLLMSLTEDGALLMLDGGGERARWREIEGPGLSRLVMAPRPKAPAMLLAIDREGTVLAAPMPIGAEEPPAWRPVSTGLREFGDLPLQAVALPDDALLVLMTDAQGTLRAVTLDAAGAARDDAAIIREGVQSLVAGADPDGMVWIALIDRGGAVLAGPMRGRERPELEPLPKGARKLLAIVGHERAGPLLVAQDEGGQLIGWSLREAGEWVRIGSADEVMEPLPEQLPSGRPG
jgi:hypothetical protein